MGKVYCVTSDSEARRGKALASLTECYPLLPLSLLYVHLGGLQLLNLMVGEDEITSDKDYKHIMKQLQHVHLHCKQENPPARAQERSWLQRKEGEKQDVLWVRFGAGLSPAMVCVGILVLGTKLNQYTLSDLNSLLANSLSYGSAK